MSEKDRKYIQSKINHMKRMGINAGLSEKGAAQPDHVKAEHDARIERHNQIKRRNKWSENYNDNDKF